MFVNLLCTMLPNINSISYNIHTTCMYDFFFIALHLEIYYVIIVCRLDINMVIKVADFGLSVNIGAKV